MSARRKLHAALAAVVAMAAGLLVVLMPSATAATWPLAEEGHRGANVSTVQFLVTAHGHATGADGDFGPNTKAAVTAFQQAAGIGADGMVGDETWPRLLVDLAEGALPLDGAFDPATTEAVKAFQTAHGLAASGTVEEGTWHALVANAAPAGDYSLPIGRDVLPRDEYDDPHHDYPAIDLPVGTGTPVLAINGGNAIPIDDSSCGYGVVVEGGDGGRYSYCHFDQPAAASGPVAAGQQIGVSGNTGNSTGPHLHVGIRRDGTSVCPQPLLLAIYDGQPPPPVADLPASGCSY